jgi:tetratricopeptide (TPR) repeat protein
LSGSNRLVLAGVLSAWISFQAQSLVSIDNIGISIWGWVLGGSIIGLSISSNLSPSDDRKSYIGKLNEINIVRVATSSFLLFMPVILIALLYRGEVNTFNAKQGFDLQNSTVQSIYKDFQIKAINSSLNDPTYKLSCAMSLVQNGFVEDGLPVVKKISNNDPRNLDALNALALISEQLKEIPDAIAYREKMAKLDPWNAVNYLALVKDYKAQGDPVKSRAMLDKILSFSTGAIGSPIAEQAKSELAS